MIMRYFRLLGCLILVFLVGCISFGDKFPVTTLTTESTPTPESTHITKDTQTPASVMPTANPSQVAQEQFVRIWLPPEFNPELNDAANALLKARLDEFVANNAGLRLEVRVKALDGPGGMLDSLIAANAAAPSALPDLVLLSRPLLESAAVKGLLYPYNGLTDIMEDQSWFDYARQLAQLKANTYGIPFAGDSMVLVYASSLISPPPSLEATLSQKDALLFPAADPQALFTLCMYLADGGRLQDGQGRPMLEEVPLANVFNEYQQASLAEVMPYTLTQYSEDEQVWEALLGGQSSMAVTWTTSYLHMGPDEQDNLAIAPLPTPDGNPYTLATGWSWALAGQDSARRTLSIKLAEFLVEKDFLAEWTLAGGYLPPRLDALQGWQESHTRQVIEQISNAAWLMPSTELISSLGPALQQAVIEVLEGKSDAKTASRSAIDQIKRP